MKIDFVFELLLFVDGFDERLREFGFQIKVPVRYVSEIFVKMIRVKIRK